MSRDLTRRRFLALSGATAALGLLEACAPAAQPSPTAAPKAAEPTKAASVPEPPKIQPTVAPTTAPVATQAPAATKAAGTPKTGGTFTVAKTAGIESFSPLTTRPGHFAHMRAIYNTLAYYDDNLTLQPELATKWDFSPDGKTLTLKLREGVKYHTGREFTSADVKASWEFATTDELVTLRAMYKNIKNVETPDKYTAVFKFDAVFPGAYDILDTLYMLDKDSLKDIANTGIGTGPFKLEKYIPNDREELVAFKDYWDKGKPYLDRFTIRMIPDLSALSINLESGAVDCVWQPTYMDLVRLRDQGAGKYVVDMGTPGANFFDIAINTKQEPFTNKKVRQAIAWSIDRARFCKTTLQGLDQPTCLGWPKISWGYQKDLEGKIGFDLDKAKALLKEAGLESGFETELMTSSKQSYGMGDLAQLIQGDLAKIGVKGKITDLDTAQYNTRMQTKRDISIAVHTYGRCNRDPGSMLTGAIAYYTDKEGSWTKFDNAEYEKLRAEVNATLDREKRLPLLHRIQEMLLDECFTILVAPQQRPWAYGKHVKGFALDHDNSPWVGGFWLEK
jgi:peptide/nickel transport system substrate-binding protein